MNWNKVVTISIPVLWSALLGGYALSAAGTNKAEVKVPGGLAMSEFTGYEGWEAVSVSRNDAGVFAMTLGNRATMDAYRAGVPGNGQPFPDGAKMAKIHYTSKPIALLPQVSAPGDLLNVDFMEKDSKRFADGGGWGYAVFEYDAASDTFNPGTAASKPPQNNDAKCGVACHTRAKGQDYVFTAYGKR